MRSGSKCSGSKISFALQSLRHTNIRFWAKFIFLHKIRREIFEGRCCMSSNFCRYASFELLCHTLYTFFHVRWNTFFLENRITRPSADTDTEYSRTHYHHVILTYKWSSTSVINQWSSTIGWYQWSSTNGWYQRSSTLPVVNEDDMMYLFVRINGAYQRFNRFTRKKVFHRNVEKR